MTVANQPVQKNTQLIHSKIAISSKPKAGTSGARRPPPPGHMGSCAGVPRRGSPMGSPKDPAPLAMGALVRVCACCAGA